MSSTRRGTRIFNLVKESIRINEILTKEKKLDAKDGANLTQRLCHLYWWYNDNMLFFLKSGLDIESEVDFGKQASYGWLSGLIIGLFIHLKQMLNLYHEEEKALTQQELTLIRKKIDNQRLILLELFCNMYQALDGTKLTNLSFN